MNGRSARPPGGSDGPALRGCTVVVTRERAGDLRRLLAGAGANVVHVPLIEVVDVDDAGRRRLAEAMETRPDWVVVTSAAGSERVAPYVSGSAAVRLAAVGTATADRLTELSDRDVDLVPDRQLALDLVSAFVRVNPERQRIVVAQADRAGTVLADGLRASGHDVTVVPAYRTNIRPPTDAEVDQIASADAVTFASGSAAASWAAALGERASLLLPRIVVAIGPTTAAVAEETGLKITHVAADHSLAGLLDTLTTAWNGGGRG